MEDDAVERLTGHIGLKNPDATIQRSDVETRLDAELPKGAKAGQVNAVWSEVRSRKPDKEPEGTGRRTLGTKRKEAKVKAAEVRDTKGHFRGSRDNVTIYRDRWGNLMGYNKNTGNRFKIEDG